jgi:hypothetical protein
MHLRIAFVCILHRSGQGDLHHRNRPARYRHRHAYTDCWLADVIPTTTGTMGCWVVEVTDMTALMP